MKFEYKNGLIFVSIEIEYDKKPIKISRCILDTGSATTAIDIDQIVFNYDKPARIRRLFGIGSGVQEVICQQVDTLTIDKFSIPEIEIEFGTLKSSLGINGFIGNDILSHFHVSLGYQKKELVLNPVNIAGKKVTRN